MAIFRIFKETENQDLAFENGDFVFVEDREAVRQQLESNLRLSRGNYFLNLDQGINYAGEDGILGKKQITADMEAEFIDTITGTFGVRDLLAINFNLENNILEIPFTYQDIFSPETETLEFTQSV